MAAALWIIYFLAKILQCLSKNILWNLSQTSSQVVEEISHREVLIQNHITQLQCGSNKKLSCHRDHMTFVSLNILLSHSRSFEMTLLSSTCISPYRYFIETMSVCRTVYEIFSVKEWHDLETGGSGRSRSLKMVPFDKSYTTFYWSAIVSISVRCTIFKLFDVQ